MKKSLLFGAALMMAAGAMAQLTPGEYYIKNVETGMFLNEGFSWGTLAVTKAYPCAFEVTAADDGGYIFKSRYGYFKLDNGEYYMDGGDATVVTYLEGENGIYNLKVGGKYMTINEEKDYLTDDWLKSLNMCETLLYTVKQSDELDGAKSSWQVISREQMVEALADATPEKPVEASFFLKAGQIEVNADNNVSSWKYIKNGNPADIVIPDGGWFGHGEWSNKTTYAWCINEEGENKDHEAPVAGTDVVSQDVEGMPAGLYHADYRIVNQSNTPLVVKFNNAEAKPYEYEESDLWYSSAWDNLAAHVESVDFEVGADGKLSIQMEKTIDPAEQNRFAFKSIALYYCGKESGVAGIELDENAPVEYFNMQGIRVANPSNGLYIKRQGKKATKVIVK